MVTVSPGPRLSAWIVIVMLAMIVVPAANYPGDGSLASGTRDGEFRSNPARLSLETSALSLSNRGHRLRISPREEVKLPRLKLTGTGSQGGKTRFDAR